MRNDLEIYLHEFDGSYRHLVKTHTHEEVLFESLYIDECYEYKFYECGNVADMSVDDVGSYHEGNDDYDTIDWIPEDVTIYDKSADDSIRIEHELFA